MKLLNRTLSAFATAAILASSAYAAPVTFTLSSIDLVGGDGYGTSKSNQTDPDNNKLDVTFSAGKLPLSFTLAEGASTTLTGFGSAHLYDTCISPSTACPTGDETDKLDVTAKFTFLSPYFTNVRTGEVGYMPVFATGKAYVGPVKDSSPDNTVDLEIKFTPVTVNFGDGGQFTISLTDLVFTSNNSMSTDATIKLVSAPAEVPEPASLGLLGLGLLGAGVARRRKSTNKA